MAREAFCGMKWLEVFLLPPGQDVSPSQVTPIPRNLLGFPNKSPVPIYIPGWREALWELSVCPRTQHSVPGQGLTPDRSIRRRTH